MLVTLALLTYLQYSVSINCVCEKFAVNICEQEISKSWHELCSRQKNNHWHCRNLHEVIIYRQRGLFFCQPAFNDECILHESCEEEEEDEEESDILSPPIPGHSPHNKKVEEDTGGHHNEVKNTKSDGPDRLQPMLNIKFIFFNRIHHFQILTNQILDKTFNFSFSIKKHCFICNREYCSLYSKYLLIEVVKNIQRGGGVMLC